VTQKPTFGAPGRGMRCNFKICFDMANVRLGRLGRRFDLEWRRETRDRFIDELYEVGRSIEPGGNISYNLRCLALAKPLCYMVWPDKFRQSSQLTTMALPTRSSFCGSTSLPSDPPMVIGASWSAGYQWPLKGRLMSGSWACRPKPSH
jgi:hypothetical protein